MENEDAMERHSIIKSIIFLTTSLFILLTSSITFAGPGSPFNNIVFFGDSLSDNGNLFQILLKYLPKSPPYFDGRFSNGAVWAEMMANQYQEQFAITSSNYAYGGQTAIFHNPVGGYLPYTLSLAEDNYLLRSVFSDRTNTLYIIWIGANDYLRGADDAEAMTTDVTNKIGEIVASLIYHGGKNFIILNLPDLGRTPFADLNNTKDILHQLTMLHNEKLQAVVTQLQDVYKDMNIKLFDVNKLFVSVINNVSEYNKTYHMNIINTQESCWHGGYILRPNDLTKRMISDDYNEYLRTTMRNNPSSNRINTNEVADYIVKSPVLLEAYSMGKEIDANGGDKTDLLCVDPDEYFFWDHVHPTHMIHTLFSKVMFDYIENNFTHA